MDSCRARKRGNRVYKTLGMMMEEERRRGRRMRKREEEEEGGEMVVEVDFRSILGRM